METLSLLFKVFWAPGEVMFKVSKNPKVLGPLLVGSLSGLISVLVMTSYLNLFEMSARMAEQRGQAMPPEAMARAQQFGSNPIFRAISVAAGAIMPVLVVVAIAAIFFAVFTLVGREGGFKAFVAITAFAFMPALIRNLASLLTIMIVPPTQIMLDELGNIGPAIMVDRTGMSPKLFQAIAQVDIISIWILVLMVIGYGFLVRKSASSATRAVCVFGVFLVYACFRIVLA